MSIETERAILEVASRSAGIATRAELRAAGVSDRTISDRARSGGLARCGPGLYAVPTLLTGESRYHRAVKAHRRAAVSHRSAARLWGFPMAPAADGEPVDVSVPRPAGRLRLDGLVVHTTRRCSADDVEEVRPGLLATSRARTIVDLGSTDLSDRRLRHILQSAIAAGELTLGEVAVCIERAGGRGVEGSGRLAKLVESLDDGEPIPESELERLLSDLVGGGLCRQFRPPWYDGRRGLVDFADPASRTIVEADGRRWHATEQAMQEDRRRDRVAAANGWIVLRVTWCDVVHRPSATAAEVATVMARRTARAS